MAAPASTPSLSRKRSSPQVMFGLGRYDMLRPVSLLSQRSWSPFAVRFTYSVSNSAPYADVGPAVRASLAAQITTEYLQAHSIEAQGEQSTSSAQQATSIVPLLPDLPLKELLRQLDTLVNRMAASVYRSYLRVSGWFLQLAFSTLHRGIYVNQQQLQLLREASAKGPVVFCPTHRSHLDYILVSFICYSADIQLPHIAAGDNLNIPFFGSLARHHGAFFIKRKLDQKDILYRRVLASYLEHVLRSNSNIELFIEGGRSRNGRLAPPKFGLLAMMVDALEQNNVPDFQIVAISINYDHVPEKYSSELLGRPKEKETFWQTILALYATFMRSYGSIAVDFAEPFSVKEFLSSIVIPSTTGALEANAVRSYKMAKLGQRIYSDIQKIATFTSATIVAFVLLYSPRENGTTQEQLVEDFVLIGRLVLARGFCLLPQIWQQQLTESEVMSTARMEVKLILPLIKDLVVRRRDDQTNSKQVFHENDLLSSPRELSGILTLSFYANQMVHVFINEAIVVVAALSLLPAPPTVLMARGFPKIDLSWLARRVRLLHDAMSVEFQLIGTAEDVFNAAWPRLQSEFVMSDQSSFELRLVNPSFLRMLVRIVRPAVDSYCVVQHALQTLERAPVEEQVLLAHVQEMALSQWKAGFIPYGESCALDTLKRGIDLFVKWDVLRYGDSTGRVDVRRRISSLDLISRQNSFLKIGDLDLSLQEPETAHQSPTEMSLYPFRVEV